MPEQEKQQPIITGVPEHLRQPVSSSEGVVKEEMGGTALGGRFGRGTIELPSDQVGPQALRQAANNGTIENLGGDRYVIPTASPSLGEGSTPVTSNSEVRQRNVETPVVNSMGIPEYPEDL